MGLERRTYALDEIRVADPDGSTPKIEGHAAVFEKWSVDLGFREKVQAGAFAETIAEDDVVALVQHTPTLLLGRTGAGTLRLREDDVGLFFSADVPDTGVGRDAVVSTKRGDYSGASFGFFTVSDRWETKEEENLRTLEQVKLLDVGPCVFEAYPDTDVAARSLPVLERRAEAEGLDLARFRAAFLRRCLGLEPQDGDAEILAADHWSSPTLDRGKILRDYLRTFEGRQRQAEAEGS